jgi:hypothetical protein
MRGRWPRLLAFGALLVALGTGFSGMAADDAPGSIADNRERFFGVVQAIYNPDRAAQAGVQWERLIFPWSLIQKDGPNSWRDGYFSDQQIAQEISRGIEVVGLAVYTPQWATSMPSMPSTTNVPANLYLPFDNPNNYWGQFMYKLAARYAGKINTWIVWNEPDLYLDGVGYTWDGSISDMYQLVKVASQAVKKANPDAKIALPGLTYWFDKQDNRPLYLARFMEAASKDLTAAEHGDYFDIVILHQYSNPLNVYVATQLLQRALTMYGLQRPIWIGESNIVPDDDPMNPIGPALHGSMDEQASYVIQAFALARAAGVERMSIYKMVDERLEGAGELYGLVRNDGSVRPAFQAFQTAVRYMSTPTSAVYTWDGAGDPPSDDQLTRLSQSNTDRTQWIWPAAVNRVTLERGPERVTVVWNASPKLVTAHIPAVTKSAQVIDKFGRDTGQVVARDGQYQLELYPTKNNTDPRDPSAYLVGGDPRLLVEKVTPLPSAVDALIQVVWPRDARSANITALLLLPDTSQPVPCRWTPTVRLLSSIDGGPSSRLMNGAKRMVSAQGLTYAVWDFNNVDISAAVQLKSMDFWLDVDGVVTHAVPWTYTNPTPSPTPTPSVENEDGSAASGTPTATETPAPIPTAVEAHASCAV